MIGLNGRTNRRHLLGLSLFLSAIMVMGSVDWSFAREGKGGGGGRAHVGRGGGGGGGGRAHVGRGGGGGNNVRTGRTNIVRQDHNVNRRDVNVNRRDVNVNRRDVNVNRRYVDKDVRVHRDVDIDYHHNYRHGYDHDYRHGYRRDHDDGWRWGAAALGTAAVVGTAVAIGSYVNSLPTTGCSQVYVGNTVYQRCGSTYYMPVYQGSSLTYQVVPAP